MQDMPHRRNDTRTWVELPAEDNGEALVAALGEAGVEYVFFTSGSEIVLLPGGDRQGRSARPQGAEADHA